MIAGMTARKLAEFGYRTTPNNAVCRCIYSRMLDGVNYCKGCGLGADDKQEESVQPGDQIHQDMSKNVVDLVPGKSDAEIAADLKARFEEAIKPINAIMDEAAAAGLEIGFNCLRTAPHFKHQLANFHVVKTII